MNDLRTAAQQALEVEADRRRKALAAEMRAALAQQAEPVAYRHLHEDGWEYHDAPTGEDCAECQALYTAPPQRKPLTDEEIIDATEHIDTSRNGYFIHIARAVERAHGITGDESC